MIEVDFKDRVPLHPGRIKLIPVEGRENVFDVVRADEPTEEGTPINKATLDSITKSRLTGRYYDLNAVVDNDTVAYTADMMPSTWDIGQRIIVQVPSFEFTKITSNTFMGIVCNTILSPTKRYELVYNGSSFDSVEINAPVAIASYLAFVGNVNQNMVDAAFGQGNEVLVRGVGEALAMYAWNQGVNRDLYPLKELLKMQTINDANGEIFAEIVSLSPLFNFIESSGYARYKMFNVATIDDTDSEIKIDITEADLKSPFRMSYYLTSSGARSEQHLIFNGVTVANSYTNGEYEDTSIVSENCVLKNWSDYNITEPGTYTLKTWSKYTGYGYVATARIYRAKR